MCSPSPTSKPTLWSPCSRLDNCLLVSFSDSLLVFSALFDHIKLTSHHLPPPAPPDQLFKCCLFLPISRLPSCLSVRGFLSSLALSSAHPQSFHCLKNVIIVLGYRRATTRWKTKQETEDC